MSFKSTLLNLLRDGAVRRAICQISSACSGGGGGSVSTVNNISPDGSGNIEVNLESVTTGTGNNITPNALQVSGSDNLNFATPSIVTAFAAGTGSITGLGTEFPGVGFNTTNGELSFMTGQGSEVLVLNKITAPTDLLAEFGGKVSATAGTAPEHVATVSQLTSLGETSTTAYRGDRGKTAYDHSQLTAGTNPHNTTFANIASKPTTLAGYGITDAFIQGGQSFGAPMSLGTNDNNPINIRGNNANIGQISTSGGMYIGAVGNYSGGAPQPNNALIQLTTTGIVLSRNIANASTLATFNLSNASASGLITDFQKAGVSLTSIANSGKISTVEDIEITALSKGLIIKSPDGTRYRIVVANGGALSTIPA